MHMTLFATLGYCLVSMPTKTFSASAFRMLAGCGLVAQSYCMYLKRITLKDYEAQIEPVYEKQIESYQRYLSDGEYKI